MEFINQFISEEIIYALGWTVLHSLWQAAAVGLLLSVVTLKLRNQAAEVRYRVAYAALLVTFGVAVATFFSYYNGNGTADFGPGILLQVEEHPYGYHYVYEKEGEIYEIYSYKVGDILQQIFFYFDNNLPTIVFIWLLGAAFFVLRLLGGLAYVQHLKTAYTNTLPEKWQYMLEDLAAQIPVRRSVELLESALIKVPVVIGHFKPVILLPVGAVNGLTSGQVEAILAHELAHIARHDYLLHILQSAIEIFFYCNPAVWWISANIRTERENCCDDTAIALCGNELAYAKALVALQEMSITAPPFAMTFATNKNQLLKRIQRILNQPQNRSDIMEKLTATCLLLAVLVGLSVSAAQPFDNFDFIESPDAFYEPDHDHDFEPIIEMNIDTFPKGNRNGSFSYDNGEKQVEARIKDDKIVQLRIDGEEIPASEISRYEDMVEELMSNVPEPPVPPMPAIAPTPPTPPTPSIWNHNGSKITKQKDKDGKTILTIEQGDGEAAIIEIGKDGKLLLDGKELLDGEEATIFKNEFFGHMEGFDDEAWKLQEEQFAKAEADFAKQEEAWRKNEEKWREQERNWERQHEQLARQDEIKAKLSAELARAPRATGFNFPADDKNWNGNGTYIYKAVGNDKIFKTIEKELLKDGLVKNSNYKLELSNQSLKINGKEQSEAIAKKYRDLYEKEADFKMKSDSRVVYNRRSEQ